MNPIQLSPLIKKMMIVLVVAFVVTKTADQFFGQNLAYQLSYVPERWATQPLQALFTLGTFFLIHQDVLSLVVSLLMLALMSHEIERVLGQKRFIKTIIASAACAVVLYTTLAWSMSAFSAGFTQVPLVGISSIVYGQLLIYALIFSERTLLFMMIFPLKAKQFILLLIGFQLMVSIYAPHHQSLAVSLGQVMGEMLGGMLGAWWMLQVSSGASTKFKMVWPLSWFQKKFAGSTHTTSANTRRRVPKHSFKVIQGGSLRPHSSSSTSRQPGLEKGVEKSVEEGFDDKDDGRDPKTWH